MKNRKVLSKFPQQFLYISGLQIRKFLIGLAGHLVPPSIAVYEKAQGFWVSRAIVTACELNLADHLAGGPRSISELAVLSGADEKYLYRLMRALAGEGIFRELPGKAFENNRLSSALEDGELSMKYLAMQQFGETAMTLFSRLTECVKTGKGNTHKLLGKGIFQFLEENPEKNEIYNKAMANSSGLISMALLSAYNFTGIRTLVDIGGGNGILLTRILEKYSGMEGILFDQPHVVAFADQKAREDGLQDRFRIVAGNFFDDIPAGADAYFMKNILHAFSDEVCLTLLKKIHDAMPLQGKLILLETITRPDNKPSLGKLIDLMMMTGTEGGKERVREEYAELFDLSGFRLTRIVSTIAPFSVIEAEKK